MTQTVAANDLERNDCPLWQRITAMHCAGQMAAGRTMTTDEVMKLGRKRAVYCTMGGKEVYYDSVKAFAIAMRVCIKTVYSKMVAAKSKGIFESSIKKGKIYINFRWIG